MKIVINACYGGFGLSKKGISEYLKLKGKEAYFYANTHFPNNQGYLKVNIESALPVFYVFTEE